VKAPEAVAQGKRLLLERFRATHPEAKSEPQGATVEDVLDWYLRPRDA
jgi:hypothetical protein